MSEKAPRVYPERPGEMSESFTGAISILERPPEINLTSEQLKGVREFEAKLFNAENPFSESINVKSPEKTLRQAELVELKPSVLSLDYFLTPAGASLLQEVTNQSINFSSLDEVRQFFATEIAGYKPSQIKKLQAPSDKFARNKLEQIVLGHASDEEPEFFGFLRAPEKLLEKAKFSSELRRYILDVRRHLDELKDDPLYETKKVIFDIYSQRVNVLSARIYQAAIKLSVQNEASEDDRYGEILSSLEQYLPGWRGQESPEKRLAKSQDRQQLSRFLSRLDKFINGASENQGSIVNQDLVRMQKEYNTKGLPDRLKDFEYSDVDPEVLENTFVDSETLKFMVEMILRHYDLLSSEEVDLDKSEHASDSKWQVVVSNTHTAMSVDGAKKRVNIPADFNRTICAENPAGALPLLDHEMTHVFQYENASRIGLKIFSFPASRANLWHEAGAMANEAAAQKRLFGNQYTGQGLLHLAAVEKRLRGGSMAECARASLNAYLKVFPDANRQEAVKRAVSRAMRVFRQGQGIVEHGNYVSDSASLHYAEQNILNEKLPENLRQYQFVGRINLDILAQLHRTGLLGNSDFVIPNEMPSQTVENFVRNDVLSQPAK
ncbi:hypothetical protein HYX70_04485 [Candidatus Saccharibacteria bacterium]|nr:hypothetical protein [Candidatus Saccharibacteria bacterium]